MLIKIIFVSKHNLPIAKELNLKNYTYLPYILDDARWNKMEDKQKINEYDLSALKKIADALFVFLLVNLNYVRGGIYI